MNEILKVENLSYCYEEGRDVLKGVSFSVNEGEAVAIIGHNGSGKSTLAKTIMGLLSDYEGTITCFGKELNRKNLYEIRSRLGIVFQTKGDVIGDCGTNELVIRVLEDDA